jgi:hypothetical protein
MNGNFATQEFYRQQNTNKLIIKSTRDDKSLFYVASNDRDSANKGMERMWLWPTAACLG